MIFVIEVDSGEIKIQDKDGNFLESTLDDTLRRLLVDAKAKVVDPNSGDLLSFENLDFDTGETSKEISILGIALPGSGGPVVGGTATNPLRTDPTGTTTQPISVASLPLPSGAATETTLASIKNTDGVKKITDPLPAGTNLLGKVEISDGSHELALILDSTTYRLPVESKSRLYDAAGNALSSYDDVGTRRLETRAKLTTSDAIVGQVKITDGSNVADVLVDSLIKRLRTEAKAILYDALGVELAVANAATLPTGTKALTIAGLDKDSKSRFATLLYDDVDSIYRLAIDGRVSIHIPPPPTGGTAATIAADTPLDISGTHDTEYVITNGKTFYLQQITAGAEGDPTEKGSKIELLYYDGSAYHTIERFYITGFSLSNNYPDVAQARDQTALSGDGSTKKLIIRRIRLSGTSQEVDAVVRGYEL